MKRLLCLATICLCASSFPAQSAEAKPAAVTAVKAGRLIDTTSGRVLERQVILIEGERIKAVGAEGSVAIPAGAQVIDLSSATVLPGLIDCHTHITSQRENYNERFRKSPIDAAVIAHLYARRTLEAGFTTCRNLGAAELVDVALKKAINDGRIPGPRLFVACLGLSATGGHGDLSGHSPYLHFDTFTGIADGVDELRKKIRWNIKQGADVIKFMATAGVLSEEESVGAPQYSFEEMKAIVDEAAMWGRRVAAHAHGAEGIKRAVRAGVASIEHGSLLDDEGIALMKERGTWLVPTVDVGDYVEREGKAMNLPPKLIEKARQINQRKREGYRKAMKAGVKIAYGTDAGVFPHGQNACDFRPLVELGMTPMQAIQAATTVAAELLGQSENLGSVQAGKFADLVAVQADPLKDIGALTNVGFVMKGGAVFKNALAK
ncbi:MAG: amidohydrolase family protein [Verrucomicrobia bacterium]|nr:amidohydrolase family protein [Verrucomicrobiota bacterium]